MDSRPTGTPGRPPDLPSPRALLDRSAAIGYHHAAMDLTAAEIARACEGRLVAGNPSERFREIAIDSRNVPRGSLFAAIPGARVDGHDFVSGALDAGARGALVMRATDLRDDAIAIQVDDTTRALQRLAAFWRSRLDATVIAVAGSNGKTTTKETLAAVLQRAGSVWATPGNANSQIGAPLALLATPPATRFVVLELGTSAPGELGRLGRMARPDHAVVTAAFAEHLEWLGSVAGVIEAETEVLDAVAPGGLALVGSAESGLVRAAERRTALRVRGVGRRDEDAWLLSRIRTTRAGTDFHLRGPQGADRDWHVPLLGEPAAWAGAFAVALASELGLAPEAIAEGLAAVRPAAHRLVPRRHPTRPLLVLDDCYNSNPASCIAAIDTALALASDTGERLVLVVGDMLELGDATEASHQEVGDAIARYADRVHLLVAVGPKSRRIADTGARAGIDTRHVGNADEAVRAVRAFLDDAATTVLAKASRGIGLDRLVEALLADGGPIAPAEG